MNQCRQYTSICPQAVDGWPAPEKKVTLCVGAFNGVLAELINLNSANCPSVRHVLLEKAQPSALRPCTHVITNAVPSTCVSYVVILDTLNGYLFVEVY